MKRSSLLSRFVLAYYLFHVIGAITHYNGSFHLERWIPFKYLFACDSFNCFNYNLHKINLYRVISVPQNLQKFGTMFSLLWNAAYQIFCCHYLIDSISVENYIFSRNVYKAQKPIILSYSCHIISLCASALFTIIIFPIRLPQYVMKYSIAAKTINGDQL